MTTFREGSHDPFLEFLGQMRPAVALPESHNTVCCESCVTCVLDSMVGRIKVNTPCALDFCIFGSQGIVHVEARCIFLKKATGTAYTQTDL